MTTKDTSEKNLQVGTYTGSPLVELRKATEQAYTYTGKEHTGNVTETSPIPQRESLNNNGDRLPITSKEQERAIKKDIIEATGRRYVTEGERFSPKDVNVVIEKIVKQQAPEAGPVKPEKFKTKTKEYNPRERFVEKELGKNKDSGHQLG